MNRWISVVAPFLVISSTVWQRPVFFHQGLLCVETEDLTAFVALAIIQGQESSGTDTKILVVNELKSVRKGLDSLDWWANACLCVETKTRLIKEWHYSATWLFNDNIGVCLLTFLPHLLQSVKLHECNVDCYGVGTVRRSLCCQFVKYQRNIKICKISKLEVKVTGWHWAEWVWRS